VARLTVGGPRCLSSLHGIVVGKSMGRARGAIGLWQPLHTWIGHCDRRNEGSKIRHPSHYPGARPALRRHTVHFDRSETVPVDSQSSGRRRSNDRGRSEVTKSRRHQSKLRNLDCFPTSVASSAISSLNAMSGERALSEAEPISGETTRPIERPIMLQGWKNLASLHWRYQPSEIQKFLPSGFTVDTFDGSAFVGLLPFAMERIRLPFGPGDGITAGRFSSFPETNVRTYIIDSKGRRGVWFFSLDINRIAPTLIARTTYGLPYCYANMTIQTTGSTVRYTSNRKWPGSSGGARSDLTIRIGEEIEHQSELHEFVSARWALGSTFARKLVWAEVDHPRWLLHSAELLHCDETLLAAAGLNSPNGQPLTLWSPGVEVRIGRPHLVAAS
jgi:uncharacterized protein